MLRLLAVLFYAAPVFFVGMLLKLLFSVKLGWLPASGRSNASTEIALSGVHPQTHIMIVDAILYGDSTYIIDVLKHAVLPALALGVVGRPGQRQVEAPSARTATRNARRRIRLRALSARRESVSRGYEAARNCWSAGVAASRGSSSDARNDAATPRIVTQWAPARPIRRPNRPAMIAPMDATAARAPVWVAMKNGRNASRPNTK